MPTSRPKHLDELEVRVEMGVRFVHAGGDAHVAVTRQLTADIETLIGVSAKVELTLPGGRLSGIWVRPSG